LVSAGKARWYIFVLLTKTAVTDVTRWKEKGYEKLNVLPNVVKVFLSVSGGLLFLTALRHRIDR